MDDTAKRPSPAEDAGSGSGAGTGAERPLTIGQVVAQLQPEFPDLSITKVRYLEDRKLLAPARSKGRYRKYSAADIRRLRRILTLQRDEYLPLEVIREQIDRVGPLGLGHSLTSVVAPMRSNAALKKEEPVHTWAQ